MRSLSTTKRTAAGGVRRVDARPLAWPRDRLEHVPRSDNATVPRRLSRAKREVLAMIGQNAARRAFGGRLV